MFGSFQMAPRTSSPKLAIACNKSVLVGFFDMLKHSLVNNTKIYKTPEKGWEVALRFFCFDLWICVSFRALNIQIY